MVDHEHPVAEVVARGDRRRLRIAFRSGEGVYADADAPDALEPGAWVAHRGGVPLRMANGEHQIVAEAGSALAEIHGIAARAELRVGFGDAELSEAKAIAADLRTDAPDLRDLRAMPFVTIDYERSRDLDQAVYVESNPKDRDCFDVYYALADAAAYIAPDSALFAEGLKRGTSFYMPGLTVPMLPRALSEGAVSLNEQVDRRAFVFRITIEPLGRVRDYEIFAAVIHSFAKLTYDGVQAFIDDPKSSPLNGAPFAESLHALKAVGEIRIDEAGARNVIRYDRIATGLRLPDPNSERLEVTRESRNDAQRWNEQISLVTNIVGAEYLSKHTDAKTGLAGLFRVHPRPDDRELESLAKSITELTTVLGLPASWTWQRDEETLATYIARLPDDGKGVRLSCALQRQAMIMGRPSSFSIEAGPHFGVGAAAYSRFSSPMREIVGIVTMQIALAQRAGRSLADIGLSEELTKRAASAGNQANRQQKKLTRACNKLAIDQLFDAERELAKKDRPVRAATVMGVTENKIYLQLDDPPIEVKLYVPDQERMLETSLELVNRFELAGGDVSIRVGAEARVQVDEYASSRERWVLRLVSCANSPVG